MSDKPFFGSNFVGGNWENGFGIRFYKQEDGSMEAQYTFEERHQGPSMIAHGGALSAVFDEALTAAAMYDNGVAFTVQMDITFKAPVYLNTPVRITSRILKTEGRKIFLEAQMILADNTVAAFAKSLFIRMQEVER